jgi:hypothetical protein
MNPAGKLPSDLSGILGGMKRLSAGYALARKCDGRNIHGKSLGCRMAVAELARVRLA